MKTSVHIKPCNVGSSELHNRRSDEYMRRINRDDIYIRPELSRNNEIWISPDMQGKTLEERYSDIAKLVKEKTGRAMQTKDRERVNKKTGKVKIIRGSTPIREGVVVISETTTMSQLRDFCSRCRERYGITPLQIYTHRDEGHWEGDDWRPNYHAHIVWDWMNHDTGKSCKLSDDDIVDMQTLLAECLEMERGVSKMKTNKRHLEREEYIIQEKEKRVQELEKRAEKAKITTEATRKARLYDVSMPLLARYYQIQGLNDIPLVRDAKIYGDSGRVGCHLNDERVMYALDPVQADVAAWAADHRQEVDTPRLARGFLLHIQDFVSRIRAAYAAIGADLRQGLLAGIRQVTEIRSRQEREKKQGIGR